MDLSQLCMPSLGFGHSNSWVQSVGINHAAAGLSVYVFLHPAAGGTQIYGEGESDVNFTFLAWDLSVYCVYKQLCSCGAQTANQDEIQDP